MAITSFVTFFGVLLVSFVSVLASAVVIGILGRGPKTAGKTPMRDWFFVITAGVLVVALFGVASTVSALLGSVCGTLAGLAVFAKISGWNGTFF